MEETRKNRCGFIAAALCLALVLVLTRGFSLSHNLLGQPDEHVFYTSAEILLEDILGGERYEPVKPYPEGTYVFRLPFQAMARLLPLSADYGVNVAVWGRIASVFYYTLGALLGLWLVWDPLRGGRQGALIYSLAVCFGLFQIEQSRYGTFDPISFLVLMLLIVLCTLALRRGGKRYLTAAGFVTGAAAAGKYPLLYFVLLPLSVLLLQKRRGRARAQCLALMLGCALLGFVLFSPSVIRSPRFFLDTIAGGLTGYVVGGNPEGYSTVPESMFSVLLYHGFYSDLPLAGVFAVVALRRLPRMGGDDAERRFFSQVLPTVTLVFLAYNLLLTTFYLRTLFPYFCISLLYASAGLAGLCRNRGRRIAALALCLVMAARGTALLLLLGDREGEIRAAASLAERLEEGDGELVQMGNGFFAAALAARLPEGLRIVGTDRLYAGDYPELPPGTRLLTASQEHGMAKRCLFPPDKEAAKNMSFGWQRFKADNAPWLAAKLYPDWIYPLFGFWVHGSTATNYEFPTNWLYERPAADEDAAANTTLEQEN